MRGLEAWTALPPSENYLQGDFKNIPLMLQDKSLITGNYGPPILTLPPQQPPPPPFFSLAENTPPHPHYFYPLIQQEEHPAEGSGAREEGVGDKAITWAQTVIMAADALLHFHSCGVAHLWVAITYQMIQTEPHDEVAGMSEYSCATLLCLRGQHCPICCKMAWS